MLEVVAREVAYQLVIHSGNQKINSQRDIRHFVKKVPILTPKNGNFSKISSVNPPFLRRISSSYPKCAPHAKFQPNRTDSFRDR